MAIAQGINGTFATYESIEPEEVIGIRKIVKKFDNNGVWEDRIFYMLTDNNKRNEVNSCLVTHYGHPQYGVTWWSTFTSVCMHEKIYTHWKLAE